MCNLGCFYEWGIGVRMDAVEALNWFRMAAELGNTEAMEGLALHYLRGEGVAKDITEAFKWFDKAAELRLIESKAALK